MFLNYYLVAFHRYYLSHKWRRATIKLQIVICRHRRTLYSVHIGNGVKTANAIREAIVCIVADWSRCNYARQGDRAKVLNSPDVGGVERAGLSGEREGSRHKSDRIFIDAKLAISSPVTIPELCISLWDSRSKVYPSRLFPPPRNPAARSTLFHAENFLPFLSPLPPPLPLSLLFLHVLLDNPLGTLIAHPVSLTLPFWTPYPPYPFSVGNVTYWSTERVEKQTIPSNPTNHSEHPQ